MKNIGFCKAKVLNLIVVILAIATCIVYGMADAKVNSPFIIAMFAVAAIVELILCVKTFPYVEYIPFVDCQVKLTHFYV